MTSTLPGVLLTRCVPKRVDAWVRRGIVPSYVAPLPGWSAVVPAGGALAKAPYDKGEVVLLNTPVPANLRIALGFFVIEGRAIVSVHPRGWRALPRWVVWDSRRGAMKAPALPAARDIDLTRAAGVVDEAVPEVRAVLRSTGTTPQAFLAALMHALGLPGADLLEDGVVKHVDEAVLVEPGRRAVERFERVTDEDSKIRAELGEHQ